MEFFKRGREGAEIEEAILGLERAEGGAAQRDASERLLKLAEKGKSALGKELAKLFILLENEALEEEVVQNLLEVVQVACTVPDEAPPNAGAQEGPGTLSGTGGVSFEWIEAPLRNTDRILGDKKMFEVLLSKLVKPLPWIRLASIEIIITCRKNRAKTTEKAIESAPAGMERLVDVLEDTEEVVRNKMLWLLQLLTEDNEQLQNFMAFREGFAKLFQIIEIEKRYENDMVVQDCLTIMNNILRKNHLTQKLFVQGNHLSKLPIVLELPILRNRSTSGEFNVLRAADDQQEPSSPKSVEEVDMSCSPAKMSSLFDGLDVISNLVSGVVPKDVLTQPWYDPDEELLYFPPPPTSSSHPEHQDPSLAEELERRTAQHIRQMQSSVGEIESLLQAIAQLALCLPLSDAGDERNARLQSFGSGDSLEEDDLDITWPDIRRKAFHLLGDIVCLNPQAAAQVIQLQVVAPKNSVLNEIAHKIQTLHELSRKGIATFPFRNRPSESIRCSLISGAVQIALFGTTAEEKAAASFFWECLFLDNESAQISVIGHAITLPPDAVSDEIFSSKVAPPAGRLLVDSLLHASSHALTLSFATDIKSTSEQRQEQQYLQSQDLEDDIALWFKNQHLLQDVHLRAARLLETLIGVTAAGKELATKIPVNSPRAGYRTTKMAMQILNIPKVDALRDEELENEQEEEQTSNGKEQGVLFSAFLHTIVQSLRSAALFPERPLLKNVTISLLRVLSFWLDGPCSIAQELLANPSSLVLFDVAARNMQALEESFRSARQSDVVSRGAADADLEGMTCLCIGLCLIALSKPEASAKNAKQRMRSNEVLHMISARIGFEVFSERVEQLARTPKMKEAGLSKRAKQQRQPLRRVKSISLVQQDWDCVQLYDKRFYNAYIQMRERIEDAIVQLYTRSNDSGQGGLVPAELSNNIDLFKKQYTDQLHVMQGFQDLIRSQDSQIRAMRQKLQAASLGVDSSDTNDRQPVVDMEDLERLKRQNINLQQEKHDLELDNKALKQSMEQLQQELHNARQMIQQQQQYYQQNYQYGEYGYQQQHVYPNGHFDSQQQTYADNQFDSQQQSFSDSQFNPQQQAYATNQFDSQQQAYTDSQFNSHQQSYTNNQFDSHQQSYTDNQFDSYQQSYANDQFDAQQHHPLADNQFNHQQQAYTDMQQQHQNDQMDSNYQMDALYVQQQQVDESLGLLENILNACRDLPHENVVKALPDLVRVVNAETGTTLDAWLLQAAEVASAIGEYSVGLELLEMIHVSTPQVEHSIQLQKQRIASVENCDNSVQKTHEVASNRGEISDEWKEKYADLYQEHTDILVLLANQELDKQVLLETVRKLGGEEAQIAFLSSSYMRLHKALEER